MGVNSGGDGVIPMSTTLEVAVSRYLRSGNPPRGTRAEYQATLKKWTEWGGGVPLEQLGRREIGGFLDWVYQQAIAHVGTNPGRTSNKARDHLRAVISWSWEEELIETPPRFPKPRAQRDVAGRHYLTKAEINALYFSTHKMQRPRAGTCRSPSADIGAARSFCFSITASTLGLSGSLHHPMNRSSGGT